MEGEMSKKRIVVVASLVLAIIGMAVFVLNGATGRDHAGESDPIVNGTTSDAEHVSDEAVYARDLAEQLLESHGQLAELVFNEPLIDLPRDHVFTYELDFNFDDSGLEINDIINVYFDADLTMPVSSSIVYDEAAGAITVAPHSANLHISYVVGEEDSSLPERSLGQVSENWGYAPYYFLVEYVDSSGEKHDKPIVTMFTVQNDLSAPNIDHIVIGGYLWLSWAPIPGADEYILGQAHVRNGADEGPEFSVRVLARTTDSEIIYSDPDDDEHFMNRSLATEAVSDDVEGTYFLFVQAVSEDGFSNISNKLHCRDIAPALPFSFAYERNDEEDFIEEILDNIIGAGLFRPVRMLDDNVVLMPVLYDVLNTDFSEFSFDLDEEFWLNEDGEPSDEVNLLEPFEVLVIPYVVIGTPLSGRVSIRTFDLLTLLQDLDGLRDRERQVDTYTGRKMLSFEAGGLDVPNARSGYTLSNVGQRVFASGAFTEYLAINMVNGVEEIDITAFNERFDLDVLWAAATEAFYQNPLTLGISGFGTNDSRTVLTVNYTDGRSEQQRKQAVLRQEASDVIGRIITPGMSELEKQIAINNYLTSTASYDHAALENAKQNNFRNVDARFNDSFTAYGVLINKSGVCQGFSKAFKLLADEAGLDSIVVTGLMHGTMPHAWNRVRIGEDWMTIDTTNNRNERTPNNFFNLPDQFARQILVEDNKALTTSDGFRGANYNLEYYRMRDRFHSLEQIAEVLAADLRANGTTVRRTEFALSDEQFLAILQSTVQKVEAGVEGMHWMGTISMTIQ